jgi:hypothetical protein
LCSRGRVVKINGCEIASCYYPNNGDDGKGKKKVASLDLCLPSNTNKNYNNKWLPIDTEQIY